MDNDFTRIEAVILATVAALIGWTSAMDGYSWERVAIQMAVIAALVLYTLPYFLMGIKYLYNKAMKICKRLQKGSGEMKIYIVVLNNNSEINVGHLTRFSIRNPYVLNDRSFLINLPYNVRTEDIVDVLNRGVAYSRSVFIAELGAYGAVFTNSVFEWIEVAKKDKCDKGFLEQLDCALSTL